MQIHMYKLNSVNSLKEKKEKTMKHEMCKS